MEAVLKRHRDVERSLPRGRSASYAYLHGHRKKTTEDVLDDIEYFNSGRMARDSVDRLYQPKVKGDVSPRRGGYLMKGSREAPEQKAKRVVPRIVDQGRSQTAVKPRKDIEAKCEELHGAYKLHKEHIARLRQAAEEKSERSASSKWKGEKKLTEEQLKERLGLLYNVRFAKTTEPHIREWVRANPPSAANRESYRQLGHIVTDKTIVPPENDPNLPGGPWKKSAWVPSGKLTSAAIQQATDKTIIVGEPAKKLPQNHFQNIAYDKAYVLALTTSVKQKRRSKSAFEVLKWK
eukprot:TRINITY_DN5042_c1_g1_i1.p1 TRINITY_DN5042_c1_g1~~TRINITY_DN5042_c1_g1_i1.p1  ORF type:complete len:326 (+),score=102.73 TRINITY_DN5042_c1_g1_i1:103-978(+)